MKIAVGSKNPAKIKPVKKIFSKYFQDIKVIGITVSSGVKEQPMNDEEIFEGAKNRAKNALTQVRDAEYGVGIEAGLSKYNFRIIETKKVEGILRNFLFTNSVAGKSIRFIKFFLSDLVTFLDNISVKLLGESNFIIVAQKIPHQNSKKSVGAE